MRRRSAGAALDGLGFLGAAIDPARNEAAQGDAVIGLDDSPVGVVVIVAREDIEIAREVRGVLGGGWMTNSELPDGVTVETVYAVEISYSPEAQAKRPAVRLEHLTRVARLLREGTLVEAGGYLDWKSALLIFRAGSEQEAIDLIRDDVYLRSGVWLDDPKGPRDGPGRRLTQIVDCATI